MIWCVNSNGSPSGIRTSQRHPERCTAKTCKSHSCLSLPIDSLIYKRESKKESLRELDVWRVGVNLMGGCGSIAVRPPGVNRFGWVRPMQERHSHPAPIFWLNYQHPS